MTPGQRHREAVLRRDPTCALSRLGSCGGRLQAHHLIPKTRLKARHSFANAKFADGSDPLYGVELDELIADGRNGIALCELHHGCHSGELAAPELPDCVWEFAEEYDLVWSLERDHGARVVA